MIKPLPYGKNPRTCPVCAFARWIIVLSAATNHLGKLKRTIEQIDVDVHICLDPLPQLTELPRSTPLLQPISKAGNVYHRRLSRSSLNQVFTDLATAAGLDPTKYSSHSGRAGFVTQALRAGASTTEVMRQTGHRNEATVLIYQREHDPIAANAVTKVGL